MQGQQHNEGHAQRWMILGRARRGGLHGAAGPVHRQRRAPAIGRSFPGSDLSRPVLGPERLRDRVRGAAGSRRAGWPTTMAGAASCSWGVALFIARLGPVRGGADSAGADRRARAAGGRRRAIVPTSLGLLLPVFPARQHSMVVGIWAGVGGGGGHRRAAAGRPAGRRSTGAGSSSSTCRSGSRRCCSAAASCPRSAPPRAPGCPTPCRSVSVLAAVTLLRPGAGPGAGLGMDQRPVLALGARSPRRSPLTVRRIRAPPARGDRGEPVPAAGSSARPRWRCSSTTSSFAAFLLITVLFLQDLWHYDALQTGLAIAPGPADRRALSRSTRVASRVASVARAAVAGRWRPWRRRSSG